MFTEITAQDLRNARTTTQEDVDMITKDKDADHYSADELSAAWGEWVEATYDPDHGMDDRIEDMIV
jgi:hypothetical protein